MLIIKLQLKKDYNYINLPINPLIIRNYPPKLSAVCTKKLSSENEEAFLLFTPKDSLLFQQLFIEILGKEFFMSFFKLVEAVNGLFPIADKRMNKQTLDCIIVIACDCSLNRIFLICFNNSHKTDDMVVDMLGYGHGCCAVGADNRCDFNDIIVCHEGQSAVIPDVYNVNVTLIVCKRIDERNSCERIFVTASLIKKRRLCYDSLILIHFKKLLLDIHADLSSCLLILSLVGKLCLTAVIILEI